MNKSDELQERINDLYILLAKTNNDKNWEFISKKIRELEKERDEFIDKENK